MTPHDYLCRLEREYVVSAIRKRIYKKEKDQAYFKRVCELKKKNIEAIAEKHNMPCMFDSYQRELEVYDEVQNGQFGGYPNFTYSPQQIEQKKDLEDYKTYYSIGIPVEVVCSSESKTPQSGKVHERNFFKKTVTVETSAGEKITVGHTTVRRIF